MPTVILDRIPLPNLKLYSTISVALLSCCLYYAIVTTSDPDWRAAINVAAAATPTYSSGDDDTATAARVLPAAVSRDAASAQSASSCDTLSNASSEAQAKCSSSSSSSDSGGVVGDAVAAEKLPALSSVSAELQAAIDELQWLQAVKAPAAAAAADDYDDEVSTMEAEQQPVDEKVNAEGTNEEEPRSFSGHMRDVVAFMCQEAVCIWVSFSVAICIIKPNACVECMEISCNLL